jgi:hypothetical protein
MASHNNNSSSFGGAFEFAAPMAARQQAAASSGELQTQLWCPAGSTLVLVERAPSSNS